MIPGLNTEHNQAPSSAETTQNLGVKDFVDNLKCNFYDIIFMIFGQKHDILCQNH